MARADLSPVDPSGTLLSIGLRRISHPSVNRKRPMLRFYASSTTFAKNQLDDKRITAAYAFCLEDFPDRIYWARGTSAFAAVPMRDACIRIMEAVTLQEGISSVSIITSNKNVTTYARYALDREAERQRARRENQPVKAIKGPLSEEEKWVRCGRLILDVKPDLGDTKNYPNLNLQKKVKYTAERQCLRNDLPKNADPSFDQTDAFDLASDLTLFLMDRPTGAISAAP